MAQAAVDLDSLSADERLDLLERIWDHLSRNPDEVPLTESQRQLLDARLDDLDRDIQAGRPLGIPWEEVRRRLQR